MKFKVRKQKFFQFGFQHFSRQHRLLKIGSRLPLAVSISLALTQLVVECGAANGVLRDGAGARAMALGGASVASPDEPLEAMFSNPAGLSFSDRPLLQFGAGAGLLEGNFANSANSNVRLPNQWGTFPEIAFVQPLESSPFSLGFSIIPEGIASTDWHYVDKAGGLGGTTSYGFQQDYAQFIAVRGAVGFSWKISDQLALGVDLGADYNRNSLTTPFVFQSYPALKGFKTLLNLRTDGWGVNGTIGLVWRPATNLSFGLSYRSSTSFDTHGNADGNAGIQLQNIGAGSFRPDFHYDSEVGTGLPQIVSAGASWQARDWLRLIAQTDWINWSSAFDHLDVKLKNGNNANINGFLGTANVEDFVPLNWKDSFVYRIGSEFTLSKNYIARVGYAYGSSPVPESTITPMSAAILEHVVTFGLEWHRGRWSVAGAYQYNLPATSNVGMSSLSTGEYSNSSTTVQAHSFGVTVGIAL